MDLIQKLSSHIPQTKAELYIQTSIQLIIICLIKQRLLEEFIRQ